MGLFAGEIRSPPDHSTWKWTWRETVKHQFFDFLLPIGLRDRLRCPFCQAVGTFKPHGGWFDLIRDQWDQPWNRLLPGVRYATGRRWVCKYCGYVRCWQGEIRGWPNNRTKVWAERDGDSAPTPKEAVEASSSAWPWRG